MAAGGRNPQKSAVARARAQARADQEGAGGGGAAGAKGRQFDQSAADDAQAKRDHTKALRVEREKKAAEAEAREAKKAAKLKKENDAKQAALGLDKIEKKNDTAEAPAPAEEADGLCDAFEGLDLSEKYGHDWSMTEVQNDKVHLLLTARVCNPESCAMGRSPRNRSSTTWMPTLAPSSKQ